VHRRGATGLGKESYVRVAFTIDTEPDIHGNDPRNAERLIDLLAERGIPATFFIVGRWAVENPRLARRIAEDGHLIGNHTYDHVRLPLRTSAAIARTVTRAESAILASSGVDPRPWFRCPWGLGHNSARVLRTLSDLGYRNVGWDFETNDWLPGRTERGLIETIVKGCSKHADGARVLLHSWPGVTLRALPSLVAELDELGAQYVRVDELSSFSVTPR
jgi:peptidoglycan/xylan/chitin deacetylase (PgdA/CDA1 family)